MAATIPAQDMNNAKWSAYKQAQFGGFVLTQFWLLATCVTLLVALGAVCYQVHLNSQVLASFKPMVIRINGMGEVDTFYLRDVSYRPQAPEVKHFLSDFVTKYYTHKKGRLEDYYHSKYYLSKQLGIQSWIDDQQTKWITKLLHGQLEETEAQVLKVSVTNLDHAPYEALIGFQRIVYSQAGDQEVRREDLTATIRFAFADKVEPQMIQYNPLGLTVTDFHADQAFH